MQIATRALCAYPVILLLSFYLTWFAGWLKLGYLPRSSLDDPKYIGGALMEVTYHYTLFNIVIGIPLFWVSVIGLGLLCMVKHRAGWPRRLLELSIAVLLMLGVFAFARWDPHSVIEWYFD